MSDKCECWPTPPETWTTYYGAVEPGSAIEFNPGCPAHGGPNFGPRTTTEGILARAERYRNATSAAGAELPRLITTLADMLSEANADKAALTAKVGELADAASGGWAAGYVQGTRDTLSERPGVPAGLVSRLKAAQTDLENNSLGVPVPEMDEAIAALSELGK